MRPRSTKLVSCSSTRSTTAPGGMRNRVGGSRRPGQHENLLAIGQKRTYGLAQTLVSAAALDAQVPGKGHKIYPYLLRHLSIELANQFCRRVILPPDGQRVHVPGRHQPIGIHTVFCRDPVAASWILVAATAGCRRTRYCSALDFASIFNTASGLTVHCAETFNSTLVKDKRVDQHGHIKGSWVDNAVSLSVVHGRV